MIIYCPECGKVIEDNCGYCPHCGIQILTQKELDGIRSTVYPLTRDGYVNTAAYTDNDYYGETPQQVQRKDRGNTVYIIIIFILLFIIALGAVLYIVEKKSIKEDMQNYENPIIPGNQSTTNDATFDDTYVAPEEAIPAPTAPAGDYAPIDDGVDANTVDPAATTPEPEVAEPSDDPSQETAPATTTQPEKKVEPATPTTPEPANTPAETTPKTNQ